MKKLLILGFLIFGLSGCATVGNQITDQQVSQIQKGVTTEQNLINYFGKPYAVIVDAEGNKSLVWTYAQATAFTVGQGRSLSVKLDKSGIVENYILSSVN
ncbi:hypothetical protein [Rahnella inusitata]|uniref:hypothetical protein n=1 Tax=Rahnella inusitata TaxID=58169 RepID=UPI001BC85D7A|nr:hypothetical protein [Rahnella inusitata]QUT14118.1 hypothetical protein I2123_15615 [Rahnella inusitata]